jgi:hemerythrin-like metal-binding protein
VSLVIWNPAWETGIDVIDLQHRELLAQFESLLVAIHENHPDDRIPGLLAFLSSYVDSHFSMEEAHMQATKYPGYPEHKAIHDEMRSHILHLVDGSQSDPGGMTEEVVNFLTDWLVSHINVEDRRMALHLHRFYPDGLARIVNGAPR